MICLQALRKLSKIAEPTNKLYRTAVENENKLDMYCVTNFFFCIIFTSSR